MTRITLYLKGAQIRSEVFGILTSGMVGVEVNFICDESWNGLNKTLVCRAGDTVKTVLVQNDRAVVAHETMVAGKWLELGVEGRNDDGNVVIPTLWERCCIVLPGVDVEADPTVDPTLPVWSQLQRRVSALESPPVPTDIGALPSPIGAKVGQYFRVADVNKIGAVTAVEAVDALAETVLPMEEDAHAAYFAITDEGILSLKPEYRGACPSSRSSYTYAVSDMGLDAAGSKNAELPKELIIPRVVNEIAVTRLADGMFLYNEAAETIVLPEFAAEIPERFCDNAIHVKKIRNTEHILTVGKCAFQSTQMEKALFPNLTSLGVGAFNNCAFLVYADIGNATEIPQSAFGMCMMLSRVKGGVSVTKVGSKAFSYCYRLNSADFLQNLTSIGDNGFFRCRLDYDWGSLQNCTFGNKATALQLNATDIWSGCHVTAAENPIPTLLSQTDPRWRDREIGTSGVKYSGGCVLFTAIHIYCALHGLTLSSVEEFEAIANGIDPEILNGFQADDTYLLTMFQRLGLTVEHYASYTQESLQALYDGLAAGKYAVAEYPASYGGTSEHVAMIYGVKANKELMIADSAFSSAELVGEGERTIKYAMPYQNAIEPSGDIYIVSL